MATMLPLLLDGADIPVNVSTALASLMWGHTSRLFSKMKG